MRFFSRRLLSLLGLLAVAQACVGALIEPFRAAAPSVRSIDLSGAWRFHKDAGLPRGSHGEAKNGWETPEFNDSEWRLIDPGMPWEKQGHSYDGVAWYRQRVDIPAQWQGSTLVLSAGKPDDASEVYLNGTSLGVRTWGQVNVFVLPDNLVRFGATNTIAVRVWDWYKNGGLSGGAFMLERVAPFAPAREADDASATMDLGFTGSLQEDVMAHPQWSYGLRDGGTADFRPTLRKVDEAFRGEPAVGISVRNPRSIMEFVEYRLPDECAGAVWKTFGADYVSLWCKAIGTEGDFVISLNDGRYRWGQQGTSHAARFAVGDTWQHVVFPFEAFTTGRNRDLTPMTDVGHVTTVSLGYRGNELTEAGEILIADLTVGRFQLPASCRPISLNGLWRFRLDNENLDEREGIGLANGWHTPGTDDGDWDPIRVGRPWEAQGHAYNGVAWYRQQVEIPTVWEGHALELDLGRPDDRGEVYFNGQEVCRVKSFGPRFHCTVPANLIRYGGQNTIAVRIVDWYMNGGLSSGTFKLAPQRRSVTMQAAGSGRFLPLDEVEMGSQPADCTVALTFLPGLAAGNDVRLDWRLLDPFHRAIATGSDVPAMSDDGTGEVEIRLTGDKARQSYLAEQIRVEAVLRRGNDIVDAFCIPRQQLAYRQRDALSLPSLAETWEGTPYGRLRLVDRIDCAAPPFQDGHPYKEGGIRDSWVGRRAYSAWLRGVQVAEFRGRRYREANNNEWFGYRLGRGKLTPHGMYVLRILYPEDKTRYVAMDIKAGRNYQGTGFRNGVGPDDPQENYPVSGDYEWYDHVVMLDDTVYGYGGARTAPGENGFWVFFYDIGRAYAAPYDAGPAVSEIRLYEVADPSRHAPATRYPDPLPRRILMMDWERQPEAPPLDVARYARFLGLTAISPTIQKWSPTAFWDTALGFSVPAADAWNTAVPADGDNGAIYAGYLDATRRAGVGLIPRIEYGGGPKLTKDARCVDDKGKTARPGRYASWGANLLHPATWQELDAVLEELIGRHIADNPQLMGVLWRMRSDRMMISFGKQDVELFCRETGHAMPSGKAAEIAKWASSGGIETEYRRWWHGKRQDFHVRVRDRLRSWAPDLQLFYYNWDPDGWNLGLSNSGNAPQDWTDYYDVSRSRLFYDRRARARSEFAPEKYTELLLAVSRPHQRVFPELYRDVDGIAVFAPVNWRYLADNQPYLDYFRTGNGLATCTMFNYEEKGRWNVQNDNYESSEMTPGGPDFAMANEVLPCFHGDPRVITWTTYTYGRGFVDRCRRFAQAFLALPALDGTVVKDAVNPIDPDIRVRTYPGTGCTYVGVVNRATVARRVSVSVPAPKTHSRAVTDLVQGKPLPARDRDGRAEWDVELAPMSLNTFCIGQPAPVRGRMSAP